MFQRKLIPNFHSSVDGHWTDVTEGILSIYPIDRSQNGNNGHINLVISVRHIPLQSTASHRPPTSQSGGAGVANGEEK